MCKTIWLREISFREETLFDTISVFIRLNKLEMELCCLKYKHFYQNQQKFYKYLNVKIKVPPECQHYAIIVKVGLVNLPAQPEIVEISMRENRNIQCLNIGTELGEVSMMVSYQRQVQVPNQIDSEISSSTMNEYSEREEKNLNEKTIHEEKSKEENRGNFVKAEGYSFSERKLPTTKIDII